MMTFLLGGLCGFVATMLIMFIFISVKVGGDKHE